MSADELAPERKLAGPSWLGGGWRRVWELVRLNAVADFQRRYAGSALGYLWTLIRPLSLFAVLYVVVTQVFDRFGNVPDYGSLLLLNIVLFTFFSEATGSAVRSLASGQIIRKVELPVVTLPLASVFSTGISLATNLLVVIVWILIAGVEPGPGWLLLPVVVAALAAVTVGFSLLFSAAWVRYRDTEQAWPALSRTLFYATPVLFPLEFLPEGILQDVQSVNPLAPIFAQARVWIIDPSAVGWFDDRGLVAALLPLAIGVLIIVGGALAFGRRARTAGEEI